MDFHYFIDCFIICPLYLSSQLAHSHITISPTSQPHPNLNPLLSLPDDGFPIDIIVRHDVQLDVARTRIMARSKDTKDGTENNNTNPLVEIRDVVDSQGVSALFAGIVPRATR